MLFDGSSSSDEDEEVMFFGGRVGKRPFGRYVQRQVAESKLTSEMGDLEADLGSPRSSTTSPEPLFGLDHVFVGGKSTLERPKSLGEAGFQTFQLDQQEDGEEGGQSHALLIEPMRRNSESVVMDKTHKKALMAGLLGEDYEENDSDDRAQVELNGNDKTETSDRKKLETSESDSESDHEETDEDYARFLDTMRRPGVIGIVKKMKLFIVSCQLEHSERAQNIGKVLSDHEYAAHVESRLKNFFQEMEDEVPKHPFYRRQNNKELTHVMEGIEKYVTSKLYDVIFAIDPDEVERGERLEARMKKLQTFVKPDNLDVPAACRNEMLLDLVQEELRQMNQSFSPIDKVRCIVRGCSIIFNTLSISTRARNVWRMGHEEGLGADEFVPAFFFAVLRSNIPNLWSHVEFIRRYRNPNALLSKSGYCFTNLQSAISFFENATGAAFGLLEQEFEKLLAK